MNYRILWLEDDPDEDFIELAEKRGFELINYKTAKDVILQIETNIEHYDGIILDIRGHEESSDEVENEYGFLKVLRKLLKQRVALPYVVYSAIPTLKEEGGIEEFKKRHDIDKICQKGRKEDREELFRYLKERIMLSDNMAIRSKYSDIFDFCETSALGRSSWDVIETCLLVVEKGTAIGGLKPYNDLRQVFEKLGQQFYEKGLLPEEFVHPQFQMTNTLFFLKGEHQNFKFESDFVKLPSLFTEHLLGHFERITNDGSHADLKSQGKQNNKALIEGVETLLDGKENLILHSLIYSLLTLLRCSARLLELNPDKEKNLTTWSKNTVTLNIRKNKANFLVADLKGRELRFNIEDYDFPKYPQEEDQIELTYEQKGRYPEITDIHSLNGEPVTKKHLA